VAGLSVGLLENENKHLHCSDCETLSTCSLYAADKRLTDSILSPYSLHFHVSRSGINFTVKKPIYIRSDDYDTMLVDGVEPLDDYCRKWLLDPPVGSAGLELQLRWWRYRGSSFAFTNLPTELRHKVYELLIMVTDKYIVVRQESQLATACVYGCPRKLYGSDWGHGHGPFQYWEMVPRIREVGFKPSPPPAYPYLVGTHDPADEVPHPWSSVRNLMLAVCSYPFELEHLNKLQLKALEKARTSFANLSDLHQVLSYRLYNELTHVGLNFSMADYLALFSVPVTRKPSPVSHGTLLQLSQVRSLRVLDLKFRDSRWNLWDHPWVGEDRPPAMIKRICHHLMIIWILECATPFLSTVPTVHIEGHIKDRVRDDYLVELQAYRQLPQYRAEHYHRTTMMKHAIRIYASRTDKM
jgi:hypothetical protein